jgi:signal transduction histidine kinase
MQGGTTINLVLPEEPYDLSHQVRTTLAIITLLSGNLDLLYDRLDDGRRQDMIHDLRQHTRHLNSLVTDILDLCNDEGPFPM